MARSVVLDPITKIFKQNGQGSKGKKTVCYFEVIAKDEAVAYAYKRFCYDQDIKPLQLLALFINTYGEAQILLEGIGNNEITPSEGIKEISSIIENLKIATKINGQFRALNKGG